jgi:hypothetical protein
LLSELRFLGCGDDKIGRFVGALAVRFIKGKAVCKTEFITQFQVGVRNTWNNADNRHKLNFSPSTGRMIRTLTSRLSRRSSSSRGKPFGKRNSITQFQVTLRNTWNNTGFVKGKAVCKTEFYYSVPGDPAEHLEQRGDGGMIRSGMYSLLGFVKGKAVCKTELYYSVPGDPAEHLEEHGELQFYKFLYGFTSFIISDTE